MFTNFILPLIIWVSFVAVVNPVVAHTISKADIEERLSGIASRYGGEHPLAERLQRIYTNARDLLQVAQRHEQIANEFESVIKRGPISLQKLRDELTSIERRAARDVVERREKSLEIAEVEQLYHQAESKRATLEAELFEIAGRERTLLGRPAQIRIDREDTAARIAELEAALRGAAEAPGDDLANAERTLIEVELAALRPALRRLDAELLSHSIRMDLVRAQRDVGTSKFKIQTRRTAELQDSLLGRQRETADSIIAKTERAQSIAASRHPIVQ